MAFNPLAPVIDYQSMLHRIFSFTSAAALVAVWILRLHVPALDEWLHRIDFTVELGGNKIVPVPGGYLFPALAVGIVARVYRLHARISDWLGIRECFDIDVIIKEFAAQLRIDLASVTDEQLATCRRGIMRQAFYPYVSGPAPAIDPQLIQHALDAWSWFWVGVESTFVFVVTGLGLISLGSFTTGIEIACGSLLLAAIGLPSLRRQCQRYAIAQVRAIVNDPIRAAAVKAAFADLAIMETAQRRAA